MPKKRTKYRDFTGWYRIEAAVAVFFILAMAVGVLFFFVLNSLGVRVSFNPTSLIFGVIIAIFLAIAYRNKLSAWSKRRNI